MEQTKEEGIHTFVPFLHRSRHCFVTQDLSSRVVIQRYNARISDSRKPIDVYAPLLILSCDKNLVLK
jgi:predicted RNA-binding protein